MKESRFFLAVLVFFGVVSVSAYAATDQQSSSSPTEVADPADSQSKRIRYKKVTELDFEDALIKGKLVRPDGDLLLHKDEGQSSHWMKLRESFGERVVRSSRSLK